ncbi:ATP-binding protein [Massilia niastensis]|uniref:ATP-binding protein n=1 Tax=Massilia niastensis TaxID=544911 RepID=UPI0003603E15|nr:ATP-binding protein [Massilia niastensis]
MTFLSRQLACRLLLIALCCSARLGSCAAPPKVLLLMPGGATAPWSLQLGEALRGELLREHADAELHLEVLQQQLPGGAGAPLPRGLTDKYAGLAYDAIVPLVPDQLPLALALRDRLWPLATVVAPALDPAYAARLARVPRMTGLLKHDVVARNLALMFALLPTTRHIGVISAGLDQDPIRPDWRAALQPWLRSAELIDLSGLEPEVLLRRVQQLPPGTALYFAAPTTAHNSAVMTPYDLVRALAPVAQVPIFVDGGTLVGAGAIGGWVVSPASYARDVASQLNRLLAGVPPERIGFEPHSAPRLQFDWRALQRAGVDSTALPAGSELLFQPPGLWEAYRGMVLATALVLAIQSILIGTLLLERRRRKSAERQTRQHLGELARLDRIGAVGALSAALAHEINQPLGAILSNAETAELLLEAPHPSHNELRELIAAIRADNQRAAAVLVRLRAWIANNAGQSQRLALNPLLHEVARILRVEVQMRDAELQLHLSDAVPEVVADGVQIQQVTLNLVLNAFDALQQMAPGQRRVSIRSSRNAAGGADVCVADSGPGLAGIAPERLFEPFFSTKPDGLGVGLSISRSILERHGGTLQVEQPAGGGALFRFSLPSAEAAAA